MLRFTFALLPVFFIQLMAVSIARSSSGTENNQRNRANQRSERNANRAREMPVKPDPTHKNVPYGDHEQNVLDIWLAESTSQFFIEKLMRGKI